MITLTLFVCLASNPDICRDEKATAAVISEMQCMIQGQQMAQEWLSEHPKWTLKGWRCGPAERGA